MGLKPDHWIRKMALEHQMIDPFFDGQKRNGVISYGLSSYGYDIRVANEFKVFTSGVGDLAVVDPKHIDTRAMVDFVGDICIIPPNSFALARSLEYMRMPRNVLGAVLGKSTYARCFRGDTRVALVDGTSPTLEEMARRAEDGELFWGYSVGPFGRIFVTLLDAPRYIGRDGLLEVILDSGEKIYCTPDHQFLIRDGRMAAAENLTPDTSLMPLYRNVARGYEMVYQPLNGHLFPTHRLADEWNVRHGIYEDTPGTHRHHLDGERLNNAPVNMIRVDQTEHIRMRNAENYGRDFDPDEHSAAIKEALARLASDPKWREHYAEVQRGRALRFWHEDDYAEVRDALLEKHREHWTSEEVRERQRERLNLYWQEHPEQRSVRGQRSVEAWERASEQRRERQLVAINTLPGDHDVFCLTVPEAGNFALEAGVFVHNCGIVTNFTPLEPGWHGFITIEISNTTPLPAKIYANEGIAQVLFFEGDEPCEISYADKKGKYQGQQGVVLPRL